MIHVGVFGSSLPRQGEAAYEDARALGREIARRAARVVCGGYGGVMEAACRGAAEAGGSSVGIVLAGRGQPNPFLTETISVASLSERLEKLRDACDAWVFLPRGLGTMLELVWIAESIVKGEARPRPVVVLGEFWRPVIETALGEASTTAGADALAASIRFVRGPGEAAAAALPRTEGGS